MYNVKIVETDKKIEVWKYSIPIHSGFSRKKFKNKNRVIGINSDIRNIGNKKIHLLQRKPNFDDFIKQIEKYNKENKTYREKMEAFQRKGKYYREKRHDIRRLIEMNYKKWSTKFITLTFSEHITDVEDANYEFKKFIQRLKRKLDNPLKYLAVWERTKKNRIHYHMVIFDLKYIEWQTLEKVWGNGFIKINDISHVESQNVGRYIAKYFSKDVDFKDYKKKAFFTSRNLKKPKKRTLLSGEELGKIVNLNNTSYTKSYKQISKHEEEFIEGQVDYYIIEKN